MSEKSNPPQGLLRRVDAARFCGVGSSTWDRLTAAGKTPQPIKLGGALCWAVRELSAWVDRGCPGRAEWSELWPLIRDARK